MRLFDLTAGVPVMLYLQNPREKVWGVLVSVRPSGVVIRGLDLQVFDDWMRQEARGEETLIGLTSLFYPMHRVERMEADETIGPMTSYADRFELEVGKSVREILGAGRSRAPRDRGKRHAKRRVRRADE